MQQIESRIDPRSRDYQRNYEYMTGLVDDLRAKLELACYQGPGKYIDRHVSRGKILPRDRVEFLLDRGSPFLELMPLAGLDQKGMTLGGSIVTGIGEVSGKLCLIHANVSTIKGGALNQISIQKSARIDEIALENRLPVIYLTESAGADLPQQALIFNYGGAIFRGISQRSRLGIPSIAVVFGSSTAGGAYIPGTSDYVIMVKNQAMAYLAGPPLVKMAINEEVDDETLGGAMMHARISGLCDYIAEDELDALRITRDIVSHLQMDEQYEGSQIAQERRRVLQPVYREEELLGIPSPDAKTPFDIREVIGRLSDGSCLHEFKPLYGESLVTGWAYIYGYPVGILANNGVLFTDCANKGSQFIQLCQKRGIPLLFLQNVTGFMVGKEAEREGIIKNGAKLINAVANCNLPTITLMIGASYGAGNYGMCGRAYKPRFLFSWPNAKLAVMGPDQLVGVLEILQRQKMQAAAMQSEGQEKNDRLLREGLRARIEHESHAYYATSRMWDDGVIDPRDTRKVVGACLTVIGASCWQQEQQAGEYGVFRM